jgi:hypothetical protein
MKPKIDIKIKDVRVRRVLSPLTRLLAPGFGRCGRCGITWVFARYHVTEESGGNGCFPLCEVCWTALETPERRMPYYLLMVQSWQGESPHKNYEERWASIREAVLVGR